MTAALTYQSTILAQGKHVVRLIPSLRAAVILEQLQGGFTGLLQDLQGFRLGTMRMMILTAAEDRQAAQAFLMSLEGMPLAKVREIVTGPLIELVALLLPTPKKEPKDTQSTSTAAHDPQPWAKVFEDLFGLATGWLGWTPATAWAATPQEITDAFTAHVEKLKAIHGGADADDTTDTAADTYSADQLQQIEEQGHDPAFDRDALHALKGKGKAG